MFSTELTLHYNYLSFLVQLFVFLGVNNCLVLFFFSPLWLCATIPTFCQNFWQSPKNFPYNNIEQIIYQNLRTFFLGHSFLLFQPGLVLLWGLYIAVIPGLSYAVIVGDFLHLLLVLEPLFSVFLSFFIHSFWWHTLPEKGCMWGKFTEKFPAWKYLDSTLAFVWSFGWSIWVLG